MTTLVDKIDALLPQTQCGLCEYPGCKPYARAIAEQGEVLDRCQPGGERVLRQLGDLMQQEVEPLVPGMRAKHKTPAIAQVREAECIGCTKCIRACPVDAILGASKQMHVVLTEVCNGCELCLESCPVDCIDMLPLPARDEAADKALATVSRHRFYAREHRLSTQQQAARQQYQQAKFAEQKQSVAARQEAIKAAVARAKKKRMQRHES